MRMAFIPGHEIAHLLVDPFDRLDQLNPQD
jgi:hypothetical protein